MPLSAFRPRSAPGTLPPAAQYTKKLSSRARDHAANDEGRVVKVLIMPAFKSGTTASADMGRANKNPCMSGQSQFRSKLNCSGVSNSLGYHLVAEFARKAEDKLYDGCGLCAV